MQFPPYTSTATILLKSRKPKFSSSQGLKHQVYSCTTSTKKFIFYILRDFKLRVNSLKLMDQMLISCIILILIVDYIKLKVSIILFFWKKKLYLNRKMWSNMKRSNIHLEEGLKLVLCKAILILYLLHII